MKRGILLFVLSLFSTAQAVDNLSTLSQDANEQRAFVQKVIAEYPWVAGCGVGNSLTHYLGVDQKFLPQLVVREDYKALAAQRAPFVTIHVEKKVEAVERVNVLRPDLLEKMKQETWATLQGLPLPPEANLAQTLEAAIREQITVLTVSEPRGIMVGMINCLPKEERGPYFKEPSSAVLLQKLTDSPRITDETLKASFVGAAHRIAPEQVSREYLLRFVAELLDREEKLVSLLQARWFLKEVAENHPQIPLQLPQLERYLAEAPSEEFDINQASDAKVERFFNEVLELTQNQKEVRRRASSYLQRVETTWREAENTLQDRKVIKGEPYFTIREIPAYLAVHRTALTGDCGTTHDFPYPYSPLERNFFLFDVTGKAIGYVGTTYLNTNRVKTLYIHDVTGPHTAEIKLITPYAIQYLQQALGVERVTISNTGYVAINAHGQAFVNEYLDTPIRDFFFGFAPGAHGDRPMDNVQSFLLVQNDQVLQNLIVRLEGEGVVKPAEQVKPQTPKEALLQFLDLTGGGEDAGMQLDFLGLPAEELKRIAAVFQNTDQAALEEYYQKIKAVLAAYDLQLSEKFLRRHENYFLRGHLNARDVLTNLNDPYHERTIQFVINIIKRGKNRDIAYDLIGKAPTFFTDAAKFREYVESIPLQGDDHLTRVRRLIEGGLDPAVIAPTPERMGEMLQTADPHIQTRAIRLWVAQKAGQPMPEPMIEALGRALKNDHHASDDTSEMAIRILVDVRTQNADVNKSLSKSLSREDNLEIAVLAGLALIRNGIPLEEIDRLIGKSKIQNDITERLVATGEYRRPEKPACAEKVRNG